MMYRLMTGLSTYRDFRGSGALGSTKLTLPRCQSLPHNVCSPRIDGARNATAKMVFRLGAHVVRVERRISELGLTKFESMAGTQQQRNSSIPGADSQAGWACGRLRLDVLLRHLVFYFEDRRALVWDPSAQRTKS